MGSSGMTIPKPMRSMKTVRKRTTSGERPEDARRDTARGNRKGSGQSSRSRAAVSAAFGAEPAEPADELARLAQERRAQARRRRLEVAVAQRAQIARELTKPRAAVPRARGGERLRLAHALLDHPQRQVERPPVTAPGRRTRTRPGGAVESLPTKDADHDAHDAHALGRHHERQHVRVRGLQTKPPVRLPAEALHGDAAVDLRHHRLANLGRLARLDDQVVAVAEALVDHRGAARAEREDRAPAPEARRQLERALDREGLEGQAGRHGAEEGDRHRRPHLHRYCLPPRLGCRPHDPPPFRHAILRRRKDDKSTARRPEWKRDPSAGEHGARRRCDMRVNQPANLLITGPPGIGKTTVLERVIACLPPAAATGFLTRELRARGMRQGFVIETLDGRSALLASVRFDAGPRVGRYRVRLAALDAVAVPALAARPGVRLVVVDEIGKMESLSPRFAAAVRAALDSPVPVLGTIARSGGALIAEVRRRPDVTLVDVTPENRDALPAKIAGLLGL